MKYKLINVFICSTTELTSFMHLFGIIIIYNFIF